MVFSSPIFLFGFLPIALFIYYLSPRPLKNSVLLITSLVFYAWGEVLYIGVMLVSIIANYLIGRAIYEEQQNSNNRIASQLYITIGIVINIGLLTTFKYANFIVDNLNELLQIVNVSAIDIAPIHLPLGISFFTFQAISYIVDVYRKEVPAQKNIYNLALYISLFPQLIAGPIVRYHDVAQQIIGRSHSVALFSSGAQRFIFGLSKKMLIANPLGEVADNIFALSGNDLTMPLAWIGILAYTLQIYFDFSGYSDMAIGLGRMFGFRFLENFNYPYISKSLREFWQRWHISLSTWFKDYVYIPLGGNRVSATRVYLNLFVVFLLTGVWHGASWSFIVWGMFHGFFLASEHMGFSRILSKTWKPIQHLYLLLIIIISWVFFRADTLTQAINYLNAMIDLTHWQTTTLQYTQVLSTGFIYIFALAVLLSLPVYAGLKNYLAIMCENKTVKNVAVFYVVRLMFLVVLFFLCILKIAASTYNPFIYFRF
ncbi:MAG: MBOAT family O-acyltransferase [Gammaproteobacteria bacterium]|nr:MBOAT family O-acyltransferase [Gammaproteobacteria bacterium]